MRSGCPINLSLEIVGDTWSLLILRDIVFAGRRHYRDLLTKSPEHIASNILAERLRRLTDAGILTRTVDPTHKQRRIYSLTERGLGLVPVLVTLGAWGARELPADPDLAATALDLEAGGADALTSLVDGLRAQHSATVTA